MEIKDEKCKLGNKHRQRFIGAPVFTNFFREIVKDFRKKFFQRIKESLFKFKGTKMADLKLERFELMKENYLALIWLLCYIIKHGIKFLINFEMKKSKQ